MIPPRIKVLLKSVAGSNILGVFKWFFLRYLENKDVIKDSHHLLVIQQSCRHIFFFLLQQPPLALLRWALKNTSLNLPLIPSLFCTSSSSVLHILQSVICHLSSVFHQFLRNLKIEWGHSFCY